VNKLTDYCDGECVGPESLEPIPITDHSGLAPIDRSEGYSMLVFGAETWELTSQKQGTADYTG
jgi:hypothetical protein